MPEVEPVTKKRLSADWFMRGALARIGETFDRLIGRDWQPSSGLATSGLVERLQKLLEAEKKEIPGKGTVVPHNLTLRMQWDKFADDNDANLSKLRNELLAAAGDFVNDHLYYTYAPLRLEIKRDYFTEGVKLQAGFDKFAEDEAGAELNVTMPALKVPVEMTQEPRDLGTDREVTATYSLNGKHLKKRLNFPADDRLTVGRTGSNGLVLDDISVSKVHASLAISGDGLAVADTGSTNGTFINGERIAYGKAVSFTEDDLVTFGTVEVRFELLEPESESEDASADPDSVQIGDLEFRSRPAASPSTPAAEVTGSVSQLETQKIDPDSLDEVK
jgi:hypothetical protein